MISVPFLFPGQLSEFSGMGRDFFEADAEARRLLDETSARTGRDLGRIFSSGAEEELHENLAAQAGVYLVSTLAARALVGAGVAPAATAGYSLGNYAAFVAAGALSYEEGLDVLIGVWRETESLGIRGAMAAVVGCRREVVEEVCDQLRARDLPVWIGNVNSSTQFVLTGTAEAVRTALDALSTRALSVLPLTMQWPIHSALMEPVARAVAPLVARLQSVRDPDVPFYGPDGTVARRAEDIRRLLATEFIHPTLWNATFEAMIAAGHRTFLEVGPGEMLGRMSRWIDRSVAVRRAGTLEEIRRVADILRA
ncbi:MAG TPA: ACP S-malonyltransferase [Thermoanaerobaculia bacterium]|nr:ACP S-malonyltransferase [Thermoanaerobaculia bacterium]